MGHKVSSKMYHFFPKFWNLPHLNEDFFIYSYFRLSKNKIAIDYTVQLSKLMSQ